MPVYINSPRIHGRPVCHPERSDGSLRVCRKRFDASEPRLAVCGRGRPRAPLATTATEVILRPNPSNQFKVERHRNEAGGIVAHRHHCARGIDELHVRKNRSRFAKVRCPFSRNPKANRNRKIAKTRRFALFLAQLQNAWSPAISANPTRARRAGVNFRFWRGGVSPFPAL